MITHNLDRENRIFHVSPTGPLQKEDFDELARVVDPFIEETGGLAGLILEATHFPGWEDFGAAVGHFRFVRDHHKKIKKVAVVTDSPIGSLAEHLASHFLAAKIKHFPANHLEQAKSWIHS